MTKRMAIALTAGLLAVALLAASRTPLALLGSAAAQDQPAAAGAPPPQPTPAPETPAAPEASSADIDGQTMFATACGFCHENGGRVEGKGPKLAGSTKSDKFLIDRIKQGKPGAMPAFGRAFSDGQIIAILAYIRGLD
jgi:mono/diheme cytochrome c family protein